MTALVSGWLSISWTSGEGVDDLLAAAAEAKNWQTDNAADSNSSTLNKAFKGEGCVALLSSLWSNEASFFSSSEKRKTRLKL